MKTKIRHFLIYNKKEPRYACNWAYIPKFTEKTTRKWNKVTCKNCIILKKNPQFKEWLK